MALLKNFMVKNVIHKKCIPRIIYFSLSVHSLRRMQKWVERIFSFIPNRQMWVPENEPDYSLPAFGSVSKLCRYIPVDPMSWIKFTFPMTPFFR